MSDEDMIVIDNGSYMIKAGFAEDDAPRSIFPTIVGQPEHLPRIVGSAYRDTYVGDEAKDRRGIFDKYIPVIENGVINNWEDMEKIWHHTFYNELRIDPEKYSILLSENPWNTTANRERMAEIMLETFKVRALTIQLDGPLSLYSTGRTEGLAVLSGEDTAHSVPVHNGKALRDAVMKTDVTGKQVSSYLQRLLNENGHCFYTTAEKSIVRDIKEKLCYISDNYEEEKQRDETAADIEKCYKLPDGKEITVGEQ